MSTQLSHEAALPMVQEAEARERDRRRRLIALLALLLLLITCVGASFVRYVVKPAPLPEILPLPVTVSYPPHYLFSIYGVVKPIGAAVSPQGDRVYVTETGGERLIKIFDRDGDLLGALAPPGTQSSERAPEYVATDSQGRVLVTDRLQRAVFVFDRDGIYQDTVLAPDLTLSAYVSDQLGGSALGTTFAYNAFQSHVTYQEPGEKEQTLPPPGVGAWAPMGIDINRAGSMLLTEIVSGQHGVRVVPSSGIWTGSGQELDASEQTFGASGQEKGQFLFPNAAVSDSRGRIFVSDSNNGRVSVWDEGGNFLFQFGQGMDEQALNLPRGMAIDQRDRLHVVDTVGQCVKVYDVAGSEARFLYAFGSWGAGDGQFNFPNDITIDDSGRLYIADRENNRIQVWLY
jgi:DNA-binding beta-propeller fold protein YncE